MLCLVGILSGGIAAILIGGGMVVAALLGSRPKHESVQIGLAIIGAAIMGIGGIAVFFAGSLLMVAVWLTYYN